MWELTIDVPTKLAPLFVAFQLQRDGQPELSRGGHRFAVPLGMTAGRVEPLGNSFLQGRLMCASPKVITASSIVAAIQQTVLHAGASVASSDGQTSSVNFVVRSRGAHSLSLILARKQQSGSSKPSGCLEIALDPAVNRTGDLWHVCVQVSHPCMSTMSSHIIGQLFVSLGCAVVQGLKDLSTLCWAWRADADVAWDGGGRFYPGVPILVHWTPASNPVYSICLGPAASV